LPIAFTVNGKSCAYTLIGPNGVVRTGGPQVGAAGAGPLPALPPGAVVTTVPSVAGTPGTNVSPTLGPQGLPEPGPRTSESVPAAETQTSAASVPPDAPPSSISQQDVPPDESSPPN
jgi:hypothetical protein